MMAPVFQLLCAALSSIMNPVAFLTHICRFIFLVVAAAVVVSRENSWQWRWGKLKKVHRGDVKSNRER